MHIWLRLGRLTVRRQELMRREKMTPEALTKVVAEDRSINRWPRLALDPIEIVWFLAQTGRNLRLSARYRSAGPSDQRDEIQ